MCERNTSRIHTNNKRRYRNVYINDMSILSTFPVRLSQTALLADPTCQNGPFDSRQRIYAMYIHKFSSIHRWRVIRVCVLPQPTASFHISFFFHWNSYLFIKFVGKINFKMTFSDYFQTHMVSLQFIHSSITVVHSCVMCTLCMCVYKCIVDVAKMRIRHSQGKIHLKIH